MRQFWCCGSIVRVVPLVWEVLGSAWSGELKLVNRFFYISWHVDVHYACLVVPVQCDATVETFSAMLCELYVFLECMYEVHCVLFSLVFYPKVVNH